MVKFFKNTKEKNILWFLIIYIITFFIPIIPGIKCYCTEPGCCTPRDTLRFIDLLIPSHHEQVPLVYRELSTFESITSIPALFLLGLIIITVSYILVNLLFFIINKWTQKNKN